MDSEPTISIDFTERQLVSLIGYLTAEDIKQLKGMNDMTVDLLDELEVLASCFNAFFDALKTLVADRQGKTLPDIDFPENFEENYKRWKAGEIDINEFREAVDLMPDTFENYLRLLSP